jgi:RsiW-degrading membrane proteinase PrsW (M82 family)
MPSDTRPASAAAPISTRILRTVAAVVGGYLIFALSAVALFQLSGRDPHAPQPLWFVAASVAYGMVFAALGGFAAARVAPSRPLLHAGGVAVALALGAGVSLVAGPGGGATWSQWAALALMAPSAYVGGHLATRSERAG